MSHSLKPPEPPLEYLEANDLQYLKADDLYFSALRNSLGVFESKATVFKRDERVKLLEPILRLLFPPRTVVNDGLTEQKELNDFPDVLDVACGEGNFLFTLVLAYRVGRCEGLDLSASRLKIAVGNWANLKTQRIDQSSDKDMAKEIRGFLATCPKNLLFEQDLRLFHRFFESVNEAKSAREAWGKAREELPCLDEAVVNFKLQNVFSYQGSERFSVVFCLRLTKWVYLTMGEESLRMLLEKVLRWVAENGVLVINKVPKHSFKQTARVIHKKQNTSMHFGRHQVVISDFVERQSLTEVNVASGGGEEAGKAPANKHFWILTRKENKFWSDLVETTNSNLNGALLK